MNISEEKNIIKYQSKDGQDISLSLDIVKRYLVQGNADAITVQEAMYFIGVCKARGLNPFKRDCYLIKYGSDPAAIVTSIDYFRARAKAQPDCQGWKKGIIVKDKGGEIKYTSGLLLDGEMLLGGFFEATPKGWEEPFRLEVNLRAYIKTTRDGKITRFWQAENQPSQIAKVAESQGLRTLWPDEFQGLYNEAELSESIIDITPEEKAKTKAEALKERLQAAKEEQAETPPPAEPIQPASPVQKSEKPKEKAKKQEQPSLIPSDTCLPADCPQKPRLCPHATPDKGTDGIWRTWCVDGTECGFKD